MERAVIFLDIDGVLVSYQHLKERHPADHEQLFVPEAVEALNRLVEEMEADLVISSAWRVGKSVAYLQEILDRRGVKGRVIGKTGYSYNQEDGGRGAEIKAWMEENYIPKRFMILDDEVESIRGHFINWWKTDRNRCLTIREVDYIMMRLERIENLK